MSEIITITEMAKKRIADLLAKGSYYALRITLKTKGCSGLSYSIEYATEKNDFDEEVVISDSCKILIDPKAVLYLLGTEMDYQETPTQSGFTFQNPNEKGRCGCGKSFHI